MTTVEQAQGAKITEIATRLNVNPAWLDALINFESGGTYDPTKKNPGSSARGLIQVTNDTAQDVFGVKDSATLVSLYPTFDSQMENVVYPYLAQRSKVYNNGQPLSTQQQLYMAVFYPGYMNKDVNTPFPSWVEQSNPGIRTPLDYINFVNKRIKTDALRVSPKVLPLLLILAVGAAWFLTRKRY